MKVLILLIVSLGCVAKASYIETNESKKEIVDSSLLSFEEFYHSFREIEIPYLIDSLHIIDLYQNQYSSLDSLIYEEYPFFTMEEFQKECYSVPRYKVKKFGRIKNDTKNNIIYYVRNNKDCPSDADEGYLVLCQYNAKGELLKYEIIGRLYASFGYAMYQYFTLTINQDKLYIEQKTIEEEELVKMDTWKINK